MLRNRRIQREIERSKYTFTPPINWETDQIILGIPALRATIEVTRDYPFAPPKLYIDGTLSSRRLIVSYKSMYRFFNKYHLFMQCICCDRLCKRWVPTYVLDSVIDEYVWLSQVLSQLLGYKLIMQKLPFDELLHTHILSYLCM